MYNRKEHIMFEELQEKGFDTEQALTYTGDPGKYVKALTRFKDAHEKNSGKIQRFYDEKDIENYTLLVHSLKSNARMVGCMDLGALAEKLQYASQDNDMDTVDEFTDILLSMYKDKVAEIKEFLDNQEEDTGMSKESVVKILDELSGVLEDYEYNESMLLFNKLSDYNFKISEKSLYNGIKEEIEEFQYDEAAEKAKELSEKIKKELEEKEE